MLGVYIHICGVDLRILHYVFLFLTKKFFDKPKLKLTFKVWGKKLNLEITCDLLLVSYQNISFLFYGFLFDKNKTTVGNFVENFIFTRNTIKAKFM